ncbi:hypothetical protein C4D10_RS22460, partial [Vibrio parahaemolyticus]|nr:hypothetical protein [Vibrio parahaemolyticus]
MRILVFGEYSGYGAALRDGFNELGIESQVFSLGDGFKSIDGDFKLDGRSAFTKLASFLRLLPRFLEYDLIIVMNPEFFYFKRLGFLTLPLFKLFKKEMILLACGDDVPFIKYGKENLIPSWPYQDCDMPSKKHRGKLSEKLATYLVAAASRKIVPAMRDYAIGWEKTRFKHKLTKVIPLACDDPYKNIDLSEYRNSGKLKILHGINRPEFKGTKKILNAMYKVAEEYPSKVELVIPDKMNKKDYLRALLYSDIIIDQTKSMTYGMNAIYGLYANKVVLAPATSESMEHISKLDSPFISIENDEENIYSELVSLIQGWEFRERNEKSR